MSTWSEKDIPSQAGRVAVVTGANAGIGFEITRALAERGATVVMACRNERRAEEAARRVRTRVPSADLRIELLDLANLASVEKVADSLTAAFPQIDLLVNNAGLMAIDESTTDDGFETQLGVNHLGHFALTGRLLPLMAHAGSRIGSMSSNAHRMGRIDTDDLMFHRRGYDRWRVYAQSKLANLLFTTELDRRLRASGSPAIAVAAHPGWTHTELGAEGTGLSNRLSGVFMPVLGQSARAGAAPMLRALTDPGVRGGDYYGPRWSMRGHAVVEQPTSSARNLADAAALWARSAELTGIDYGI